MSDTLLSYAVSANESPIQASPQTGDPSLVTLIIVVSNSTHKLINCQSISFGFLQGTDAKDFFSDSTGIGTSAPTGWSMQQDGALFTATPETTEDGQIGASGLTFVLSNIKVNQQPGTTQMTITEVTSSGVGTLSAGLAKFPPQFEVSDLQVDPSPPIALGGSVTLSWSGTGDNATYVLQYEDADSNTVTITHPVDEPDQPLPSTGSYTIANLQKDTTFYLIVTTQVEGQDEPLVVERFFPVTVEIPNVQIQSFTAQPSVINCPPGSPPAPTPVTLTWNVVGASQLLLDGQLVEGNSAVVTISEDTTFTLEATGSPYPVYASATATFVTLAPEITLPSGDSVQVQFVAPAATYTVNWSVDWETGETAGTVTNSMQVTSGGGPESVVWDNVPMDMPPPYGSIVAARCTITGFPNGDTLNLEWQKGP